MVPGVVSFLQAKDVPVLNNYAIFYATPEEIFIKEKVQHAGQAVGLILAESREAAFEAVKKVKIMYDNVKKPLLDIKDSIRLAEKRGEDCILEIRKSLVEPQAGTQTVKGEFRIGSQYHLSMETQSCICIPKEDGMDVYCSTQYPDNVQATIAAVIGIPTNE
jgi:xanthine dehydrogenase/oxidase